MSSVTRIWPSQPAEAPMPMVGTAMAAVMSRARALGDALDNHAEGAGLGGGLGLGQDAGRLASGAALGAEAAVRQHRLRAQADVAHHRHAARGQIGDGFGDGGPALQLDRLAPVSLRMRAALA